MKMPMGQANKEATKVTGARDDTHAVAASNLPDRRRQRRRVLFVAEAMTLCHVIRPLVLAQSLPKDEYEIHFACSQRYHHLLASLPSATIHPLDSVDSEESLHRMAHGKPNFSTDTLRRYAKADLDLIADISPQLVVGDMRLSLSASARIAGTPFWTITNAQWSPYASSVFNVPELPITRIIGPRIANGVFKMIKPLAFATHCAPLNRVRQEYGLPPLGRDLRQVYTSADLTLYADVPELVPTSGLPPSHHYLGPILWSFPAELPAWWDRLPTDRPVIYVSLGSSGRAELLATVLDSLKDQKVILAVGTSARACPANVPANAMMANFLPAKQASARADLVITHGGSAPAYVALAEGTPVLAVPSNMDQHQTAQYVEQSGAGVILRAEDVSKQRLVHVVSQMLSRPTYTRAANRLGRILANYDAAARFQDLLDDTFIRNGFGRHAEHRQTRKASAFYQSPPGGAE